MTAELAKLRFLRDKQAVAVWDETQNILNQLRSLELEIDCVFGYIRGDTKERMTSACETLSRIEAAINLLRRLSPPPTEIIQLLVAAANHIQGEQKRIQAGLTSLLKTIHADRDLEAEIP